MIKLNNVSHKFKSGYKALKNINLNIETGEFIFITGPSGAGKSTLLNIISAIAPASSGQMYINNLKYSDLKPEQYYIIRQKLGLVPQTPILINDQTVSYNTALPLIIQNKTEVETFRRVRAVLDKVSLPQKSNCIASTLSGGEKQRVAIARAIVNRPLYIIADEPTGNLDPKLSIDILNLLIEFNNVGIGVIMATHDTEILNHHKFRKVVINNGHIVADTSAIPEIA